MKKLKQQNISQISVFYPEWHPRPGCIIYRGGDEQRTRVERGRQRPRQDTAAKKQQDPNVLEMSGSSWASPAYQE